MEITHCLKQCGKRVTRPRQELLQVLADYPLSVQEIYAKLKQKNVSMNLVSVYRSLELFVEMGIVRVVNLKETSKRYELVDTKHHHHHLVCTECNVMEDISVDEDVLLSSVSPKSKFQIVSHDLEFFGICSSCQKKHV